MALRGKKIRVACVFGTRPEAIKMAPVVQALLAARRDFQTTVMVTAQHRGMLDQVLEVFGLRPEVDLDLMRENQTPLAVLASALSGCGTVFEKYRPQAVLVQGDTSTALAAALAAFHLHIPVGHIEAGLRTHNPADPFPEEMNRRLVSQVATWHFAATPSNRDNLLNEGIVRKQIFIAGNPVVDAMRSVFHTAFDFKRAGFNFDPIDRRLVLVTAHRRENFGKNLEIICRSLLRISQMFRDVEFVFPVHPNPAVQKTVRRELVKAPSNLHKIAPMAYPVFINLMGRAALVLTDSGGIQEEAPALGVPALILRKTTERPEALRAGARLVPLEKDAIVQQVARLLKPGARRPIVQCPFGDGHAGQRIADFLLWYYQRTPKRPQEYRFRSR